MHRIPNILTRIRMILTPFWLVLLYTALFNPGTRHTQQAMAMLAFMAFTDYADGALSKMNGGRWKSEWGAIWDPIADKGMTWPSLVLVCIWMLAYSGTTATAKELVVALICTAATVTLTTSHIHLDYVSTQLRGLKHESAQLLGRLKFLMDLTALFLALLGAWSINRSPGNITLAYALVTASIGLAVALATSNINNRRSTLQTTTS